MNAKKSKRLMNAGQLLLALFLGILIVQSSAESASASLCSNVPARPALQSPTNGAVMHKHQINLQWRAAECATQYSVVVREGASFGRPVDAAYRLRKLHYSTRRLPSGAAYWWIVEACNKKGCASSDWGKFTIAP